MLLLHPLRYYYCYSFCIYCVVVVCWCGWYYYCDYAGDCLLLRFIAITLHYFTLLLGLLFYCVIVDYLFPCFRQYLFVPNCYCIVDCYLLLLLHCVPIDLCLLVSTLPCSIVIAVVTLLRWIATLLRTHFTVTFTLRHCFVLLVTLPLICCCCCRYFTRVVIAFYRRRGYLLRLRILLPRFTATPPTLPHVCYRVVTCVVLLLICYWLPFYCFGDYYDLR